jgi:ribulose-5-phosphate 4-epimerase/fuculose-1-phosphate aldolase
MSRMDERSLRVDLAACYRLVALFGWDDLVFTHVSVRLPGEGHAFLINPYGMLFEEITASSLVKVDQHGEKLEPSDWPVNPAGFVIHSAVHAARHDVACVLHVHTNAGVAVSAQKEGLLPISQISTIALASLGYHDYEGIALRDDEKPRLVKDLGQSTCLILRNHGLLTVGSSVAEAFVFMYALERACEVQIMAQSGGAELTRIDPRIVSGAKDVFRAATAGVGAQIAWPALLRKLDRMDPSYKT